MTQSESGQKTTWNIHSRCRHDAVAFGFGFDSFDEYIAGAQQKFSLVKAGIFDRYSTRLLLINGMEDSIFPFEDSFVALRHGRVKDARFLEDHAHVGNLGGDDLLYDWFDEVVYNR